jgi:dienelactone hydrolase
MVCQFLAASPVYVLMRTVRTYIVYPEDKSTQEAIVIFTDVMGMDFNNVQLIADQFAANGYFVTVPDLLASLEVERRQNLVSC